MSRTIYVNGTWLQETEAKISVFDRGFLFGDAVYEVTCVVGGKLVDYHGHAARLTRSLASLSLRLDHTEEHLLALHREIVERNALDEGLIYVQVSRGVADRDHAYPPSETAPTFVMFTQAKPVNNNPAAVKGITIECVPDQRWERRDIKTVQLLGPILSKMEARSKGADDAWMVEQGFVTECTASSAFIVTHDRKIVTRHLSTAILPGITRQAIISIADEEGFDVVERPFTVEEAESAAEAFTTGAINLVLPVVKINGKPVADGRPGALTMKLRQRYFEQVVASAI